MKLYGRIAKSILVASTVLFASWTLANGPEAIPGEYVVKLKDHVKAGIGALEMKEALNVQVKEVLPNTNILVVKASAVEKSSSVLERLSSNPMVEIAEPNFIYRINRLPDDPQLGKLWGMKNIGQADSSNRLGVAGIDIGAEQAWDVETGSKNVIVAVIDTGVDYTLEDLKDQMWVNEAEKNGQPGVDDDGNGYVDDIYGYNFAGNVGDPKDDNGHGSHCSGTIGAAGNDGKGIVGVAWNVRIMALKFLTAEGSGSLADAVKAIDYATKMGATFTSNSWGGGGYSDIMKQSIEKAGQAGKVFIAAAGNESNNNDRSPSYPASYQLPNVLSVAAIDNTGALAGFSNYGATKVHLAAPGVNILSSTPKGYQSWSGTSMATPHVAGVTALLLSHEPNLAPEQVIERLVKTVKPIASARGKTISGGMVNAFYALTNQVAPPDENDPSNWRDTVDYTFSSPHPYKDSFEMEFEISVPNAQKFAVHFSKFETEAGYDKLIFSDQDGKILATLSGVHSNEFSPVFNTNKVKVKFKSDRSQSAYGFDIDKLAIKPIQ